MRTALFYLLVVLTLLPCLCQCSTASIRVDVTKVVRHLTQTKNFFGLSMDYLMDAANRRPPQTRITLTEAFKEIGVKYFRYPGGEISQGVLWSVPPFEKSDTTLARTGSAEFPWNDKRFIDPKTGDWVLEPWDFDSFMETCLAVNCEPTITVCHDSAFLPARNGGTAPTYQQLLDTAVAWVAYAKRKNYTINYWEIGNESYLEHASYNGWCTMDQYAQSVGVFGRAMKKINPNIKIGANGAWTEWYDAALEKSGDVIDFLVVHDYPCSNWHSYEHYRNTTNLILNPSLSAALRSVYKYKDGKNNLTLALTEYNSADFGTNPWPMINTVGHALVMFDIGGVYVREPLVDYAQVWVTRWISNAVQPLELWDVFTEENQLSATGRALSIWGHFLLTDIVDSTIYDNYVRSHATYDRYNNGLNIFLINKDTKSATVDLNVNGYISFQQATIKTFVFMAQTGNPDELDFFWGPGSTPVVKTIDSLSVILPPVSITVVQFTK